MGKEKAKAILKAEEAKIIDPKYYIYHSDTSSSNDNNILNINSKEASQQFKLPRIKSPKKKHESPSPRTRISSPSKLRDKEKDHTLTTIEDEQGSQRVNT